MRKKFEKLSVAGRLSYFQIDASDFQK